MPEVRRDLISGRRIILAPERHTRPQEYGVSDGTDDHLRCPFCAGSEELTPAPVCWYPPSRPEDYRQTWRVRVIENKYPALLAPTEESSLPSWSNASPEGIHEVFVESREHVESFGQLSDDDATWTWLAYRDRILNLHQQEGWSYAQIFKNARKASGASIAHSHSQLLATRFIPSLVETELAAASEHHQREATCLFCTMIEAERTSTTRVIVETDGVIALCPAASRFPYEVWLLPTDHLPRFEVSPTTLLERISKTLKRLILALDTKLDRPPYNYFLHTTPFGTSFEDTYHWHLELFPRVITPGGYEWATDCYVNTVLPEQAAHELRGAWPGPASAD